MEKLVIRKNKRALVYMQVNLDTYQKIEKAANEANFSVIEMLDKLVTFATNNLEIKEVN